MSAKEQVDYKILHHEALSENVFMLRVYAPEVCRFRRPGQFVLVSVDNDYGERIPLTIADADEKEGSITLIFQRVGLTTTLLSELAVGDSLASVLGPLGQPTKIEKLGKVVCVGGGIGVAPMRPIAKAFKEAGNEVICILGARNRDLIILEDKIRSFADQVIICTDDGSAGRKALVTEPLKELCEAEDKPNLVVAIGPTIMMKFCSEAVRPTGVPIIVSLNTIMVDGTGMCGGCRVNVGGQTKFVCVDGPEFDGLQVDWDGMMSRMKAYSGQERKMLENHQCNLEKAAAELEARK
ncbi:MAG: sulfide/dihydroorotate dehydrogenase-like FAD/NAD-binding protein [Lentisphaerae bacterium]|jgi:ferredoxin--NADP+ reductase|nr:sulfide/dihydroorotate dehydrogenase-like FAD/NAD-binding protein [Lentisphaerota bacterium]